MNKVKQLLIFIILILLESCTINGQKLQEKNPKHKIYNIHKINVKHIPNYSFDHPTFNKYLEFVLSTNNKNSYKGDVNKITELHRFANESFKKFSKSIVYNKKGLKVKKKYNRYSTYYSFYNSKNNLIKEFSLSEADTTSISEFSYNDKNQLIRMSKIYPKEEDNRFDWFISIEHNAKGNPIILKNNHPNKLYSYVKHISYDGNIVTIKNEKEDIEEILIFSNENNVLKQKHGTTLFDFYNDKNQLVKRIVFEKEIYTRTITYKYDEKGDRIKSSIFNDKEAIFKDEYVKYQHDSIGNITYKHYSYNPKEDDFEEFFEIEYFNNK